MDKSTPFRLLFYEAPRYDENGDLVYPEPVVVVRRVSEVRLGLRWIRRRLGLRAYGKLIEGCRFRDEILPLPDPVNPLALSTTQVPAKLTDAIPSVHRLQRLSRPPLLIYRLLRLSLSPKKVYPPCRSRIWTSYRPLSRLKKLLSRLKRIYFYRRRPNLTSLTWIL
jgi:hypothetical protein